jgi:hypothetical protein
MKKNLSPDPLRQSLLGESVFFPVFDTFFLLQVGNDAMFDKIGERAVFFFGLLLKQLFEFFGDLNADHNFHDPLLTKLNSVCNSS